MTTRPKMRWIVAALVATSVVALGAQATRIISSGTLPAACTVGNLYLKTGTGAGLYICLATDTWTGPLTAAGGGDVTGPAGATDEALARFDGTTGTVLQDSAVTLSNTGVFTFPDGVRQTFNPDGTNAGFNVGSHTADPASPSNGDCWYNSTTDLLKCRIDATTVDIGNGSGASATATYLTNDDETATLTNSRQLLAGTNITLDDSVPGELTIAAAGGGGSGDVAMFARDFSTTTTIVNDNTEQTLYSVSVPGNTLGANGMLRITLAGTYQNNSGATRGTTFRIKFGTTTLWGTASGNVFSASTVTRPWRMEIILANANATNAQRMITHWTLSSNETASVAGFGGMVNISTFNQPLYGTASEDTTGTLTFAVTWQHTVANANLTISRTMAIAELIPN